METLKSFAAMLVAVVLILVIANLDVCFFCFVARWKDTIGVLSNLLIALSVLFAARQFYLARTIRHVESAERVLNSIREVEHQMYQRPALFKYILEGKTGNLSPESIKTLERQASRLFDDATRCYRTAHMYRDLALLREQEMLSVEYGIRKMFELNTYYKYWEERKYHYADHYKQFYVFMEKLRESPDVT